MSVKSSVDYRRRFKLAADTERWAVTMTKVRIRQAVTKTPFPHCHLLTFAGPDGGESRGVVDLIAIRKDHSHCRPAEADEAHGHSHDAQHLRRRCDRRDGPS
jgi:hypothetical protein